MSVPYTLKISVEQAKEMPMVDLAFLILKSANEPFYYRDLMNEIAKIKGISEDEVMDIIAQLYTEINIDGRFACVGTNLWGLKRWYPLDKGEDNVGSTPRPRIINDEDDDDDLEDEEELYDEDDFLPEKDSELDEDLDEEVEDIEDEELDEDIEEDIDEELEEDYEEEELDADDSDEDEDEELDK